MIVQFILFMYMYINFFVRFSHLIVVPLPLLFQYIKHCFVHISSIMSCSTNAEKVCGICENVFQQLKHFSSISGHALLNKAFLTISQNLESGIEKKQAKHG